MQRRNSTAAAHSTGAGPTREAVEMAIARLKSQGREPTVRLIEDITGGTTAVVNRHWRDHRNEQKALLDAVHLPQELLDAIRTAILKAKQEASADWASHVAQVERHNEELIDQLAQLEEKLSQTQAALQQEQIARAAAELALEREAKARDDDRAAVAQAREQLAVAKSELEKVSGELAASLGAQNEARLEAQRSKEQVGAVTRRSEQLAHELGQANARERMLKDRLRVYEGDRGDDGTLFDSLLVK